MQVPSPAPISDVQESWTIFVGRPGRRPRAAIRVPDAADPTRYRATVVMIGNVGFAAKTPRLKWRAAQSD